MKYYNNHILVSTKGRIIGLNIINKIYFIKGQYIKPNGYLCVNIDGIPKYVHRLVGEVFIPNPNNFPEINTSERLVFLNNHQHKIKLSVIDV